MEIDTTKMDVEGLLRTGDQAIHDALVAEREKTENIAKKASTIIISLLTDALAKGKISEGSLVVFGAIRITEPEYVLNNYNVNARMHEIWCKIANTLAAMDCGKYYWSSIVSPAADVHIGFRLNGPRTTPTSLVRLSGNYSYSFNEEFHVGY